MNGEEIPVERPSAPVSLGLVRRQYDDRPVPSCTAHDVDRVLTRQGFIITHQRGSHKQVGWSEEEFRKLL
jgi:hypothetical protein